MSHYLVTGGLGVVGSLFAEHVAALGNQVTVWDDGFDRRHGWTGNRLFGLGVSVERESIGSMLMELGAPLNDFDFILHAAASTGIPYSAGRPDDDWNRNAETTRILLEELRGLGPRAPRTVVLSSVKPCSTRSLPLTEDSPVDPDEPYAASKAAQAALCQAWGRTYGLPVWVLRCSNLYGPAPCHGPRHGWLTWFCIQAALGWPLEIQGSGEQVRDMLYSDDLIEAIMRMFHTEEPPPPGELYMMGGAFEKTISVNEAAQTLGLLQPLLCTRPGPARSHEDDVVYTSTYKFDHAFPGWRAQISPKEGMARILSWARQNADALRDIYRDYAP